MELRETYLSALARGRVKSWGKSCTELALDREIRQIKAREQNRRKYNRIRQALHKAIKGNGLARVNIPDCDTNTPFPEGPDPKHWKGPWKSITNPDQIASHVISANR
jgi:hypothetical protein